MMDSTKMMMTPDVNVSLFRDLLKMIMRDNLLPFAMQPFLTRSFSRTDFLACLSGFIIPIYFPTF